MKRLISINAVVVALLAMPAMAADMPVKAPDYSAPSAFFNWTGAYAGISLGGRWTDTAWTTTGIGSPLGSPDLRVGKNFLHVCSLGRCSHVFGL